MLAALSAKPLGGAAVFASAGIGTVVSEWTTIGASVATIIGCAIAVRSVRRPAPRQRRAPRPPKPPAAGAPQHEWDLWHARCEQFYEDQKGQQ